MNQRPPRRWLASAAGSLLLAATLLVACGGATATCDALSLDDARAAQLRSTSVDFAPQLPCAYRHDLAVERIFDDRVGADTRVNFLVTRGGERVFIFSQTRGEVPFRAVPRSTHNIAVTAGPSDAPVTASGFAGPAQAGDELAYLRWRIDGVTYELAATLSPWFSERDTLDTAASLITSR